ncbi:MAG: diguanylate cyclase, partial [Rhodocyclaceae bacterium]|nr:diguanylate cyclase [Rhodocyclaceae bacterium]
LRIAVAEPYTLNNDTDTAQISASIGVSLYPDDHVDAGSLLRHADKAMYRAKESGRNRYCFYNQTPSTSRQ